MTQTTEIEFITEQDAAQAERLCGALSEVISNWMDNNGCTDAFIVLAGLSRALNATIGAAPCLDQRNQAATAVIDMILSLSNVEPQTVMQSVSLIGNTGGFDA